MAAKKTSCHNIKGRRLVFWAENIEKISRNFSGKSFSEGQLDFFCIF